MRSFKALSVFVISAMFAHLTPVRADIIHVDTDAPPGGDGRTWETAFDELQDALAVAQAEDEIWVAKGTYTPDQPGGDRAATFQLLRKVGVYGGFGAWESRREERDPGTNVTTLSGDVNGDDGGDFENGEDNSYHVVTGSGTNATAVIDGFTITAGNADGFIEDGRGAGMYNAAGSPTVAGCRFTKNWANEGAGMFNFAGSPRVTNCTFTRNIAYNLGGGMFNMDGSSPTVTNCDFLDNRVWPGRQSGGGGGMANWGGETEPTIEQCSFSNNSGRGGGGGIFNISGANPTLIDCTFTGNGMSFGGGMFNFAGSSPTLLRCTFDRNGAWFSHGGGMLNIGDCSPTLTDCKFTENTADWQRSGGGMRNEDGSSPTLANCSFTGNVAGGGGGMSNSYNSGVSLRNCTFTGNRATSEPGGGLVASGRTTLTNCTFTENTAVDSGGGMASSGDLTVLTNCTFTRNSAEGNGGAMTIRGKTPVLTACRFTANTAVNFGGALFLYGRGEITMTNCEWSENAAGRLGGGVYSDAGNHTLANCTLAGNTAVDFGGGMYIDEHQATLDNCVLWQNSDSRGMVESSQITNNRGQSAINYSCVQGWTGELGGEGNIGDDPRFANPEQGDYHLGNGSPAVDAADNTAVPEGVETDLDGNPRFVDDPNTRDTGHGKPPIVDMGSYEFQACTGKERLRAKCKGLPGANKIKAMLKKGPPRATVTFRLDGDPETDIRAKINKRGKAKARFARVESGAHRVTVIECGVSADVDCP